MTEKDQFTSAYEALNQAQKKAVDTIEGPVMVVAGPGTGKTQVLALRIGNILKQTDTLPGSILCLTFTRSGMSAMRERLETYIGIRAKEVKITTFHSFAIELVETYFTFLDFHRPPQLLDDTQAVFLIDEILVGYEWDYLRPRTNTTMYFSDLKQLISILKRERMTPEDFLSFVEHDIEMLRNDPDNISSRGPSKGQLKKDVEKKIESLERTREVVRFYELYEALKREREYMDYDDVLEYAVQLMEVSPEARADIQEEYQYILIDEHQDSSGVQNSFLKAVWRDVERPNIFVVGDDRQLIYGFSGASLDYFQEFSHIFGKATLITLTENYRSTSPILSLADALLQSSVTKEKLLSNTVGEDKIILAEYHYPRDEIIGAGIYFKKLIDTGTEPKACALLVPKNHHVRSAVAILRGLGLPVTSETTLSLFSLKSAESLRRIFSIISDASNSIALASSIIDETSGIPPITAHTFLRSIKKPEQLTLQDLLTSGGETGLFQGEGAVAKWGEKLFRFVSELAHQSVSSIVSVVGNELLIDQAKTHEELVTNIEIVRSFIHLAMLWEEKNHKGGIQEFVEYLDRLEKYGTPVPVVSFGVGEGIRVMTLHKSKGLEYQHVWIAHMNEEVFMSEKKTNFTLPEKIKEKISVRDEQTAKRELYVAITRAKEFCTISYAGENHGNGPMEQAHIIQSLSDNHFHKKTKEETQNEILSHDIRMYVAKPLISIGGDTKEALQKFVCEKYPETKVSVTLLNNFFECPWKWYFRNFLRLPESKAVSLALGSAVHHTIEFILKSKELPSPGDITQTIHEGLLHEGVYDEKELRRLGKAAQSAVDNWVGVFFKHLAKDYASERSISLRDPQFPNLIMYGKIDLTERFPDGTVVVTDFKTGSSKTTGMIEKIDDEGRLSGLMRQLAMYSYLLRGGEHAVSVTESRLLFLEEDAKNKNAVYATHIEEEHIALLIKDVTDYQKLLHSGEWMNRPCYAKSFGITSNECIYCKRAERIFEGK